MLKKYLKVLLLALSSIALNTSCECEEKVITTDPPEAGGGELPKLPKIDVVETYYDGKIVLLANEESNVLDKIRIRASQNATLDDFPHFVLLDEASAAQILADESKTTKLKQLYAIGSAIGCVKPSDNWIKLYSHLTGIKSEKQSNALRNMFDNALFYIIKADGNVYMQTRYDKPAKVTSTITTYNKDSNSTPSTRSEEYTIEHNINDYRMGRIAEKLVQWLNDNKKENAKSPYFVNDSESMDKVLEANLVFNITGNVSFEHHPYGDTYDDAYTNPKFRCYIRTAYSEDKNMDLYDIQIEEEFNAPDIFEYENVVSKKSAAYKWKYTGFTYAGPEVELFLDDKNKEVPADIVGPVPSNEGGSKTTLHVPGGFTVGGSVTASLKDFALGFASSYSLPADIEVIDRPEMPVVYSVPKDEKGRCTWKYDADGAYYHGPWGSNSTYERAFPDISVLNCKTNQAALLTLAKSREYYEDNKSHHMLLGLFIRCYAKWARGGPWEGEDQTGVESCVTNCYIDIPEVLRYFKDYRPVCYGKKPDKDEWNSLVLMLQKGNPNFNALYKNRIGGTNEENLQENAEDIWNITIDQLIRSFGGTPSNYEYTVGLQDVVSGEFLPNGIRITPSKWEKVSIPTTE